MLSQSLKAQLFIELHREHLNNIISLYQNREYAHQRWFTKITYIHKVQQRLLASIAVMKSHSAFYASILNTHMEATPKDMIRPGEIFALGLTKLLNDARDFTQSLETATAFDGELTRAYFRALWHVDHQTRYGCINELIAIGGLQPELIDVLRESDDEAVSLLLIELISDHLAKPELSKQENQFVSMLEFLCQHRTKLSEKHAQTIAGLEAHTTSGQAALIELRASVGLTTPPTYIEALLKDELCTIPELIKLGALLSPPECLHMARALDQVGKPIHAYVLVAVSGLSAGIPLLIERMQSEHAAHAAMAGFAFTLITGLAIEAPPYGRSTELFSKEHQDFIDLSLDDYLELPLPNYQAVLELWRKESSRFDQSARYLSGRKIEELSKQGLSSLLDNTNLFYQYVLRGEIIKQHQAMVPPRLLTQSAFASL